MIVYNLLLWSLISCSYVPNTDDARTHDVATTRDYENVTNQLQPSADVKARHSASTIDDSSSSQYETLTSAKNDTVVMNVYQQLGNN